MKSPLDISAEKLRILLSSTSGKSGNIAGIALRSPIYLMQDNAFGVTPCMAYHFENSSVVWVNPLVLDADKKIFSCSKIFVFGDAEPKQLLATARHFAGLVSFLTNFSVLFEADRLMSTDIKAFNLLEVKQNDFVLDNYVYISNGYPIGGILDIVCNPNYPIDQLASLSLAHIYEASSSLSPYWRYLCYWKILEVLMGKIQHGSGPLKDYIVACAPLNQNEDNWTNKIPDSFGRLYGTRNSISHWQNDREPEIKDPSDENLREKVEEDLPILLIFMRYSLNPKFGLTAY